MWGLFDTLLHDDPQHRALAFCVIWWIPLMLIPFAAWAISRAWSRLTLSLRLTVVAGLFCPILLSAMQLGTHWYLAGYWAPLFVYPVAVAGYACLVLVLWLSFQQWLVRATCILLVLPVGLIAFASFSTWTLLIGMFAFPHASGRLTPTVTWRTDWTSMSFTSDWVAYNPYTNPRWFPLVKREVVKDRCFTSAIVEGNPSFRSTQDGNGVIVSCRQLDGTVEDKVIQIDLFTWNNLALVGQSIDIGVNDIICHNI